MSVLYGATILNLKKCPCRWRCACEKQSSFFLFAMISLRKTITYQDRLWTNTQGTGQLLKRGPIFAQRSTPAMTGHAFVRETCLLAANISAIIGEPSSEQKRYTDYAEGTLANFTKEFLNTSAGIYAAPGAENGRNAFHSIPFSMGKRSFAETGSERT